MTRRALGAFGSNLLGEFFNGGGTWSVQTTVTRTSRSALRTNPTTTNVGWVSVGTPAAIGTITDIDLAPLWYQVWFRYDTKAASNWEEIAAVMSFAQAYKLIIGLNSSGNIVVYDKDVALVATGTKVLTAGTWYCLEMKGGNGTSAAYEVRIDGTLEMSGTCNQLANTCDTITCGKKTNRNGNTVDYFYEAAVIDDAEYPGGTSVRQLVPRANGSTMAWTGGTGASDYTTVDECPVNVADYVMSTTGSTNQVGIFAFDSTVTAGITGQVKALLVVLGGMREDITTTSANKLRLKSGATTLDNSQRNYNLTDTCSSALFLTDPATAAAWSLSAVDAVEAGSIETLAVKVRMAQVFITVEYAPQNTRPFFMLAT